MILKYLSLIRLSYLVLICLYSQLNGQSLQVSIYPKTDQGTFTANGERYDMYGLTAAHPSLPFNTLVEIKNLSNKQVVTVRINDRSPQGHLNLSYAAAKILNLVDGKSAVKLNVIGSSKASINMFLVQQGAQKKSLGQKLTYFKPIHTYTPEGKVVDLNGWGVQISESFDLKAILKQAEELNDLLFRDIFIQVGWSQGKVAYRLLLGAFSTYEAAEPLFNLFTKVGFKPKIKAHF